MLAFLFLGSALAHAEIAMPLERGGGGCVLNPALSFSAGCSELKGGCGPVPLDNAPSTIANLSQHSEVERLAIDLAHAHCFTNDRFPSAKKCRECHPDHYREWSVSPHAYAQLSPVFNAMSGKLNKKNNGTLGDFCIRCHTPVGMALNEPIVMPNADRHPTSREGVTCVVCHRINQAWGKGAGRQALVEGDIHTPISGPVGSATLARVLSDPKKYGTLKTDSTQEVRGREIHANVVPFFQLTTPGFCGTCHDVFAPNGFRLEDAFSEYKNSPAALHKKQTCQDCHMGKVAGNACGYHYGPAAVVGNATTQNRKRTNHMIVGPDYSIVHPGIFPHNPAAVREEHDVFRPSVDSGLATIREWLLFDHEAGWGTKQFEEHVSKDYQFPGPWKNQVRRYRARDILDQQFRLLGLAAQRRHQLLATGYRLGKIELVRCDQTGLKFETEVRNGTDGHGVPTGFDAERVVFLRVFVHDANGKLLFISGDLDCNGDLRDSHSSYVHNGLVPIDQQLFSLQTRFVTRNLRGGEREQVLNVPFSLDPLPYVRPETRPFTVLGRPVGARKHKQNILPGGSRRAVYHIPKSHFCGPAPYHIKVQLIAGMVPVNLIREIAAAGFDYGLSAQEVAARVVAGHEILHERLLTVPIYQARR